MGENERLYDFQKITAKTAARLVSAYLNDAAVTGFAPLAGGMSTSNYAVWTNRGEKFVLRVYPEHNDHSRVEAAALAYAWRHARVPRVFGADSGKTLIPNAFILLEFIEGPTLHSFLAERAESGFPLEIAQSIGGALARLHRTAYPQTGLLDGQLRFEKALDPPERELASLLADLAGSRIAPATKERMLAILSKNTDVMRRISEEAVFSHGDFNFSNILISESGTPALIDFEYAFAAPRFYDIGKFFRSRAPKVQRHMTPAVADAFAKGYNGQSARPLPKDWYALSKWTDAAAMLHLINRPDTPDWWGADIDEELQKTLALWPDA